MFPFLLLIKSDECLKVHLCLNPEIDFSPVRDGYDLNEYPGNKFSRETNVRTCDPYFPAMCMRKSIVSPTECIFDLPRFTRKIFLILRTQARPFHLYVLIGMRRHGFRCPVTDAARPTNSYLASAPSCKAGRRRVCTYIRAVR